MTRPRGILLGFMPRTSLEIQMSKRLLIFGCLLGMAACVSSAPSHQARAMAALGQAHYSLAFRQMLLALEADPDNLEIQKRTEQFRVLYNLDQARNLIQSDKELEGIENLRRLLEEYPVNQDAQRWLRKGILKLAQKVRFEADEALASGKLAKAQQYYAHVLLLVPGNELAIAGLALVEARVKSKLDKAEDIYNEAVDAKAVLAWERVLYLAKICRDFDPSRRDAASLERAASSRTAKRLRESAEKLRKGGHWGAAAKTYRLAAGFAKDAGLPWAEEVDGIIDELMKEMEASNLLERAELFIKAGNMEKADELIEEADPLCQHDRFRISALRGQSLNAKAARIVARAETFARDHRYERAIELYKQLMGGPSETLGKSRIEQIEESLAENEKDYQKALKLLAEGKKQEAMDLFRAIHIFNPRFKDVEKRLVDQ